MFFDKYNNIDCKEIIQECIFYVNIADSLLFSVGSSLYLPSNKSCRYFFVFCFTLSTPVAAVFPTEHITLLSQYPVEY